METDDSVGDYFIFVCCKVLIKVKSNNDGSPDRCGSGCRRFGRSSFLLAHRRTVNSATISRAPSVAIISLREEGFEVLPGETIPITVFASDNVLVHVTTKARKNKTVALDGLGLRNDGDKPWPFYALLEDSTSNSAL